MEGKKNDSGLRVRNGRCLEGRERRWSLVGGDKPSAAIFICIRVCKSLT
jgi:hypothetical protein